MSNWESMLKPLPDLGEAVPTDNALREVTIPLDLLNARTSIREFTIPCALHSLPICPLHVSTRSVLTDKEWFSRPFFLKHFHLSVL